MDLETQLSQRQQLIVVGILRDLRGILHGFVNRRAVNNSWHMGKGSAPGSRPAGHGRRGRNKPCGQKGQRGKGERRRQHGQHGQRESRSQRERQLQQVRAAWDGLARVNLWRWLGRTVTGSDRVLCHRELLRLEAAGFLKRYTGRSGRRTTHVKLTTNGLRVARRLLAQQNDTADEPFDVEDIPMLPLDWPVVDVIAQP